MDFLKHEGFRIFNNNNKAITIIEMKCAFVQQEGTENPIIKKKSYQVQQHQMFFLEETISFAKITSKLKGERKPESE